MDINKIKIGNNPPWELNVLIEIPLGGAPVKYEFDKDAGVLFVDRFMSAAMHYPANYGFIPHTLADDGDPLDALVLGDVPVIPGAIIRSRPIGVLVMEDEKGEDEKVLMVPADDLQSSYNKITSYLDLPEIVIKRIEHFFEHYKKLEEGKWVKIKHWGDQHEAAALIERYRLDNKAA